MAVKSYIRAFVLVCAAAVAGIAASVLWRHPAPAVLTTGTLLTPSRRLPDFSLIDQEGKIFESAELRGHWSLLFFGYTNCPDFCPATLTQLAAMQRRLRAAQAPVLPQVLFVSVDPAHDTPAQLKKYIPNFDPDFIGLTAADQPSIEAVAKELGVVAIRSASGTVDHSAEIFVVTPDGRLRAILTGPFSVDALLRDFEHIVKSPGIAAGRT